MMADLHGDGAVLSVQDIHAGYGKKEILHGLSLSVRAGEIVALIGLNGAGKSTLLKVAAGMLMPTAGRVIFNAEDVTELAPHLRIRKGIGYFMQGGEIFSSLSVQENLELGGERLSREVLKHHLEEVWGLFPDLREMGHRRAGLLSGGERQTLALGMILMHKPGLLLLDEPSAGLAPKLVKIAADRIVSINKSMGSAVLLVEQNVREALRICHRVCILKDGCVVREGDPQEYTTPAHLEDIFFS